MSGRNFDSFYPSKAQIFTIFTHKSANFHFFKWKKGGVFHNFCKKIIFFEEFSPMQIVPHTQHLDPDQSPILFVCYVNYITIP